MQPFKQIKTHFAQTAFMVLFAFLCNQTAYYLARLIAGSWHHHDMTTTIDEFVPFLPWTVSIYFGCYLIWAANYALFAATDNKDEAYRFFSADVLSKIICFILFLAIPTTNVRPEIIGDSIWDNLMRVLYTIDSADNLFPSIHCLVSWLCWVGIRKRKDVHVVYRWFSFLVALAVCITTLTTRQHVIADVVSGVLLAEICYIITGHVKKIRDMYGAIVTFVTRRFAKKTS